MQFLAADARRSRGNRVDWLDAGELGDGWCDNSKQGEELHGSSGLDVNVQAEIAAVDHQGGAEMFVCAPLRLSRHVPHRSLSS